MRRTRWYTYPVALMLGVGALVAISLVSGSLREVAPIIGVAVNALAALVVLGALGYLLGTIWPATGWRIGLMAAFPMILVLAISVAFAGYFVRFLQKDMPVLAAGVLGACFAAAWSSRIAARR